MIDSHSQVLAVNDYYLPRLLEFYKISFDLVGHLVKINGFTNYNHLVDINSFFSSAPRWFPVDRTGSTYHPIKWAVSNIWQAPTVQLSLVQAMETRVTELLAQNQPINLYWSGGIDSTTIVTAFLKNTKNLDQLRIVYSPWSTYEHPGYIDFLKKFPGIELIDQSNDFYLYATLDGLYVQGEGGDEYNASIDESFLEAYGYQTLHRNWIDFFTERGASGELIDFCTEYFAKSQRPIETVLEARWWFYMICKSRSVLYQNKLPFFFHKDKTVDPLRSIGFYDCPAYEAYIYWNTDKIMPSNAYSSYKQELKNYCFEFDNMEEWYQNKTKFSNGQLGMYIHKKNLLNDTRWIAIMDDGTRISTPNLPFLSKKELDNKYGDSIQLIFNKPE